MRKVVETLACCLLAVGVILVLAVADARTFPDAEFSSLYEFTRQQAYSRFKDSDARVPARDANRAGLDLPDEPYTPNAGVGAGARAALPTPSGTVRPGTGSLSQAKQMPLPQAGAGSPLTPMPAGSAQHEATHDHNSANMTQGNSLAMSGQLDAAIASFRAELQGHPNCALAHHRLGDVLAQKGDKQTALTEYAEVLRLDPSYYCVHLHVGDILLVQGQGTRAEEEFSKAIEGYGEQISEGGPQAMIGRYYLADFYLKHRRNLEEAVKLAEAASASTPPQASYYLLLSRCYEAVERKPDALTAIDRAIQLSPQQAEAYRAYRERLAAAVGQSAGSGAAKDGL